MQSHCGYIIRIVLPNVRLNRLARRSMQHLAIIMDGNRRWAKKRLLKPFVGHREGTKAIEHAIRFCVKNSIPYLSLFALSLENLQHRSQAEQNYLFRLISDNAHSHVSDFVKEEISIRFLGDYQLFPDKVRASIQYIEDITKNLQKLRLNILFCYGARQEIIYGIKSIIKKIKLGLLSEEEVTHSLFERHLWTHGIPEPDLIIRTGGRKRLSNFLLYQAAYSELFFLDCLWPDLTEEHLFTALTAFQTSQRNFGV